MSLFAAAGEGEDELATDGLGVAVFGSEKWFDGGRAS
jgi:hypothetical protein